MKKRSWINHFLSLAALVGALVPLFAGSPLAHAGGKARPNPNANFAAIHSLFNTPLPQVQNPARHTFVFWVNGDQDHFQPSSGLQSQPSDNHPHLFRTDAIEVSHILEIANSCQNCNIVILHDQRGSAHWYTSKKPWASYLRVYSRGHFLLQRHVDEVDETDPHLTAWLLNFSQGIFPDSELHLIYRGHSFRAPYVPGSKEILPFDYSNREHGYSENVFLESLEHAGLRKRLGSITLAACAMSSIELATRLPRYAQYFVGSELNVLEFLDVGFRFNSLMQVTDDMDDRQVSWLLGWRMLEAFRNVPVLQDAMMEFPTTWTDLNGMDAVRSRFDSIVQSIESLPEDQRAKLYSLIKRQAVLTKTVSDRYIETLRNAGKPQAIIELLVQQLRMPAENKHDLELGLVLDQIAGFDAAGDYLHLLAADLKKLIPGFVRVINQPEIAGAKTGLSVSFQDPPHALLPTL